ncbi:MAG TPA: N-acetyltransferase, partial [Coxiellaceae bacterium]|nr:N-acetyltransferase [Coxiellaceae bacterium]
LARDVGCMIGTMTVYINSYHSVADIGIMLGDKNYWGKGIGKEAWESVMNLLLNKTEIRKVTGGALSCNNSMVKIFKGTGMQEDGVRKNQEIVDGKLYDIVHFAKF